MKQYTFLLTTELSEEWNSGRYYKAGLEKNGHRVIPFNVDSVTNPREKVLEMVKQCKPDYLLHLKGELPAETFEEIRGFTKVIQWYPDPVIPDWLPPYVRASDIFLTMSEGLVEEFRKIHHNVFWLSQAFEPSSFRIKEITPSDRKRLSSDVTFVGNLGSKPQYLPRRDYLKAVLKNGFDLKWWGPRLPRKLSTVPLLMGRLGRAYGGSFVGGETHAKISKLSKIYLGFDSMPHVRKSMSERMYIAVGCGAFYMCLHVDGIEEVLAPDKEIASFGSEDEMTDKIRYYLKHDELRKKIAEAGRARVLKDHTYEIRTRQMMEMIENAL